MSIRIDPQLHREIAKYGGGDLSACMNCGNCTATCPLSTGTAAFPRRIMHYLQAGMGEGVERSLDPWLCYYCGECSETCPRDANPGESMMAARRYLTSRYDWTGLSRKLYLSTAWEVGALLAVGLFVIALFYLFHGPMVTSRVELNTFAPVRWVELGDLVMAGVLSLLLLSNAFRMFRYTTGAKTFPQTPLSLYLREIPAFFTHFATQKRWRECDDDNHIHWKKHVFLVSGYLTMLTLIVVFLRWFQTDVVHPFYHPQRLLGYYATATLLYVTVDMMISRYRRRGQLHKYSEPTDWMFLVLLFLTALTGILLHLFRITGFPLLTYYIYVIHLSIAVPMLVIEVPFGKWAHLFYRPFAAYLNTVREKALQLPAATAN